MLKTVTKTEKVHVWKLWTCVYFLWKLKPNSRGDLLLNSKLTLTSKESFIRIWANVHTVLTGLLCLSHWRVTSLKTWDFETRNNNDKGHKQLNSSFERCPDEAHHIKILSDWKEWGLAKFQLLTDNTNVKCHGGF